MNAERHSAHDGAADAALAAREGPQDSTVRMALADAARLSGLGHGHGE